MRVAITATVAADAWGVRRDLLPWLQYHVELGAARFYVSPCSSCCLACLPACLPAALPAQQAPH